MPHGPVLLELLARLWFQLLWPPKSLLQLVLQFLLLRDLLLHEVRSLLGSLPDLGRVPGYLLSHRLRVPAVHH
jgi:hypothetical protein